MTSQSKPPSWLASSDSRPFVVTLVAVGWLVLYGLVGINAVGSQLNGVVQSTAERYVEPPPIDATEAIAQFDRDLRAEHRASLDRLLAAALAVVSGVVFVGAIGLLRRKPWSVRVLWGMGATAITASALHTAGLMKFDADQVAGVAGAKDAVTAVAAVAFINVALQSLPTLILMGLSRHPAVRRYLEPSEPG